MKIVTSGPEYVDVDAYGGCVAYAELLGLQGEAAQAMSTAPINESITSSVRAWHAPFETSYEPNPNDEFAVIDVSDPEFFDPSVDVDRVTEIIDHHPGFEDFWKSKIGDEAHIDFIGAACTLVYERWLDAKKLDDMSTLSARLLLVGIIDNTLDLKIGITTERDRDAYNVLTEKAQLPEGWKAQYFHEYAQAIEADMRTALKNDLKKLPDVLEPALPRVIGQIVVWEGDGPEFIERHIADMRTVFEPISRDWGMNVICVPDNKSYIVAQNLASQVKLSKVMGIDFKDYTAPTERLWLRKEILKAGQES